MSIAVQLARGGAKTGIQVAHPQVLDHVPEWDQARTARHLCQGCMTLNCHFLRLKRQDRVPALGGERGKPGPDVSLCRDLDVGTVALGANVPLGTIGLVLALVGILFAVGGAAIDTCLSGAYNLAQYFGWEWGKHLPAAQAPRFTLSWLVLLVLALAVVATGIDPVILTEYSVIFSVVALPLTYLPILLIAGDRSFMGEHANGRFAATIGWIYFGVIIVLAVASIPLLLITNGGGG